MLRRPRGRPAPHRQSRSLRWSPWRLRLCACSRRNTESLRWSLPVTAWVNTARWSRPERSTFADAVRAVRERGRLMQEACPPGAGCDGGAHRARARRGQRNLREVSDGGQIAVPANLNAPGQIVIAGHAAPVRRAIDLAKERGATMSVELKVSAPVSLRADEARAGRDGADTARPVRFRRSSSRSSPTSPPRRTAIPRGRRSSARADHCAGAMGRIDEPGRKARRDRCDRIRMRQGADGPDAAHQPQRTVRPLEDMASLKAVGEAYRGEATI